MIEFVSLNAITADLLEIIRQAKVSRSEPISRRQLEAWVHQYRAVLIKRDLDKGKMPNPDYIQEIPSIELEVVDRADGSLIDSTTYMLKTKLAIPNTIDLNFKSGFMYVGSIDGREFQFISEGRSQWQQYKKYTSKDEMVFLRNGYLYLLSTDPLRYITVRGVFEIPTDVSNFVNPNMASRSSDLDDPYPIPITLLPALKDMILKSELGIEYKMFSDKTNDSASSFESSNETK
jgi:hypothetical protein